MGKRFLVLVLVLCAGLVGLLSGCSSANQSSSSDDFSLKLYLKAEENSEDSNSQTETLKIEGTSVDYTWTYAGDHSGDDFDPEKKESFRLADEHIQSLKLFVKEQGLNQNVMEEKSMGEYGNTVEMTLTIEIDGIETQIAVSGMSAIDGDGKGESNLENFAYVEAAQDLIYTVKDLGGVYNE